MIVAFGRILIVQRIQWRHLLLHTLKPNYVKKWREICHIVCVIFRSANNVHCAKQNCANQECMRKLSHSCLKSFHCCLLPAFWLHKNPFSLKKQYINFLVMIFRWWWFFIMRSAYLVLVNDRTRQFVVLGVHFELDRLYGVILIKFSHDITQLF